MNELLDLQLDEVSLVDSPANKSATVALFKRDDTMTDETKQEELEKAKSHDPATEVETPEEDATDTMTEAEEAKPKKKKPVAKSGREIELEAEVERLTKALEEKAQEEVTKADEMIDFGGEMIAKSAIPAPVLKKLEEVQKAQEAQDLRKRAEEELPNFAGTADQRGKLLKSIGNDADLLSLLKSADAAFAGLFKEVGKTDADTGLLSADQKLDALVKNRQEEKKEDFYKAYAAVIKTAEGKDLLLQTYKK